MKHLTLSLLTLLLAVPALADDEFRIRNDQVRVEYDLEDGDLEIDDTADFRVRATRVTATTSELLLHGVALADGSTGTLRVWLAPNSPLVYFQWRGSAAPAQLRIELDDNNDRWKGSRMTAEPLADGAGLRLADASRAGYLVGWLGDTTGTVTHEVERDGDVVLTVRTSDANPTFVLGKYRVLPQSLPALPMEW